MYKLFTVLALVASASAFAPSPFGVRTATSVFSSVEENYGRFDGKMWDNEAKKEMYASWNPNAPRSPNNFNPFETFDGNSPDASGNFPGESFYKDPLRGNINFAQMMVERNEAEERAANPKAGDKPGAPGNRN